MDRRPFWIPLVFVLVLSPSIAIAQPITASSFSNRTEWTTFDWEQAPLSALWSNTSWSSPERTGEPAFENRRMANITIGGVPVEARSYIDQSTAVTRYKFQLTANSLRACDALRQWGMRSFGPAVTREASYTMRFGSTPDTQLRLIDQGDQWILGTTSLTLACLGSAPVDGDDPRGVIAVLTIRADSPSERVTPLSPIRCVGAESDQSDMILVLDEWGRAVRRADLSPFATNAIFSETSVQFSPTSDSDARFTINRITGQLVARLDNVSMRWQCDRTELGTRRF